MALMDPQRGWWGEQCPGRGDGLSHAHDVQCTDGHALSQCCECGRFSEDRSPVPEAQVVTEVYDHGYIPTLGGRCGRHGCGQPAAVHKPLALNKTPDANDCTVDHNSIDTKRLLGDSGYEWTRCPMCFLMVEPKAVTGNGPEGNPNRIGRGDLTGSLQRRLRGWLGWVDWNGGGR